MAEKRLNVKEVSKVEYAKIKIKDPNTFYFIKDAVAYIPAADVVEVRHGEWGWYPDRFDRQELLCTKCEKPAPYNDDGEQIRTLYCPNCGAKMDGKDGAE